MVNYKRVICEVAVLLLLVAAASAAPAVNSEEKHIDQRQNGTENYRLNIDGVVIAVAPVDSFLSAASDIADLELTDLEDFFSPPKPVKPVSEKPAETSGSAGAPNSDAKPQRKDASARKQEKIKRMKQRLANVLIPLLRKNRSH